MATFNSGCIPLFVKYEGLGIEQVLTFGGTGDSVSGLPLPTRMDEFEAVILRLPVDIEKAKSLRPVPENQSVFGIPAPKGVDVRKAISDTAKKLCTRFTTKREAAKFYKLAVSPEGRALFLMSFWVMRAEQFQHLTRTLLQYLSKYYCSVLNSAGPAKDLIPTFLSKSLARILVCGCHSGPTDYDTVIRRKRRMALRTTTRFVAKYFSGSLGLGSVGGDMYSKVLFDTKAVSPLIASRDIRSSTTPIFMSLT